LLEGNQPSALQAAASLLASLISLEEKEQKEKTKVKMDPIAPKKPLSAYMIFAREKRKHLLETNAEFSAVRLFPLLPLILLFVLSYFFAFTFLDRFPSHPLPF